jgi:MFS family permease
MDRNVRWLGFGAVVRAAGMSLIAPYFVLYLRNVLGLGYAEIGLLSAVVGVAPLVVVSFAGLVVDRAGRRRVLLLALLAEALAILGSAASMEERSLVGVIGFVIAVGVAGSVAGPAISAYVADFAQGSERTTAFTWVRIGWNVGFSVGVLSGGSLIGLFGFPAVGFAAGLTLVGSTTLLVIALDPSEYDRARAAGVPRPTGARGSGLRDTFRLVGRDRVFLALCASVAVAELSVGQWSPILPLYANTVLGVPYALLGVALALNGVLVVVAQAPTTRLALGHRHTSVLVLGILLYVVGFLTLTLVALVPGLVLGIFFGAVIVLTMGENVMSIPTTTLPSNLAPASEIGAYNGAFFALVGVGQVLSAPVGGLVLAATSSPVLTWTILMVPSVPALLLLALYVRPRIDRTADRA